MISLQRSVSMLASADRVRARVGVGVRVVLLQRFNVAFCSRARAKHQRHQKSIQFGQGSAEKVGGCTTIEPRILTQRAVACWRLGG